VDAEERFMINSVRIFSEKNKKMTKNQTLSAWLGGLCQDLIAPAPSGLTNSANFKFDGFGPHRILKYVISLFTDLKYLKKIKICKKLQ
jgi:hypothetical protein